MVHFLLLLSVGFPQGARLNTNLLFCNQFQCVSLDIEKQQYYYRPFRLNSWKISNQLLDLMYYVIELKMKGPW